MDALDEWLFYGQVAVSHIVTRALPPPPCLSQEGGMTSRMRDGTSTWDSGIGGLSITSQIATQLEGNVLNVTLLGTLTPSGP